MLIRLLLLFLLVGAFLSNYRTADTWIEEAQADLYAERYQPALRAVDEVLSTHAAPSPVKTRAQLLKAEILLELRQPREALAVLESVKPLPEEPEQRGRYLLHKAHALYYLERNGESEQLLAEAGKLADAADSRLLGAEVDLRRSVTMVRRGDRDQAMQLLPKVIETAKELGRPNLELAATGNYGFVLLQDGRYDEALTWFERGRGLIGRAGGDSSRARIEGNVGWCLYRLGDFDGALARFDQAAKIYEGTENRLAQQIWTGNQGVVLLSRGDYPAASKKFASALQIARSSGNERAASGWLVNLADAALETGDIAAAESFNREASQIKLRLKDTRSEIYVLNIEARIARRRGQMAAAEKLFRQASSIEGAEANALLDAEAGLAGVYADSGRRETAIRQYQRTVDVIEKQRSTLPKVDHQLSYFASLIRFYQDYVQFLVSSGLSERAFELAESSRGRLLAHRAGYMRDGGGPSFSIASYRKDGRKDAVVLSYWLAKDESYLWVLANGRVQSHKLPPAAKIRAAVEEYNALIQAGRDPLTLDHTTGDTLFQTLLGPALPVIPAGAQVIIVPDGPLHGLSFESLPVRAARPHYWIEDVRLTMTPSLALLNGPSGPARPSLSGSILLIGDPEETDKSKTLQFVRSETDAILKSLPQMEKTVFTGASAKPEGYLESHPERFQLIHFAAHAVANPSSPLDSAVLLSGPEDKRKLFARDVMSLPLNADLVTLSACRGAGAKVYAGEGLVGLAWAFLHAGAKRVVAGLWEVDDRSTATLMQSFYAGMASGAEPVEALREAKLEVIRSGDYYRKPFYWAAFQLYRSR